MKLKPYPNNAKKHPNKQEDSGRDEKGRFKPGISGNPDGPPKFSLISILKEQLQTVPDGEKETYAVYLIKEVLKKAIQEGDHASQRMIMNYIEGMPKQSIDLKEITGFDFKDDEITEDED